MVSIWGETDRSRGILTTADREFLLTPEQEREAGYTRQGRSKRWRTIRERVENALLDLSLLVEFWPADQRAAVFDELIDEWRGREALADLVMLFYLETVPRDRFDDLFSRGVRRAEGRLASESEPEFVSVRPHDELVQSLDQQTIEEAIWKYTQGDQGIWDLSEAEMRVLVHLLNYQEFSAEDFHELLEQLDRVAYEMSGGRDAERRARWLESQYQRQSREKPTDE